ncbi:curli-like amyloid fiber formation chaperone CsgH [uncultured Pontibacter sp.]|uniref:curli-like amyloid fiber formation chaperone CsgH n=1 Tax=uncultured Pontibacter sp. TaxID=453356 RepID=UPI00260AF8C1|nr:curli-like amyloid fiber formation chaperone CsgH [uncultured Pontibacter sp.]
MTAIFLPLLALLTLSQTAQNPMTTSQSYQAKLVTEELGNMLSIDSRFTNNTNADVSFTYRMKSERSGAAGKSVNSQSGTVKASAGQTITLSKSSFSVTPQDTYTIVLEIIDKEKVIAQDQIVYQGK